MWNNSPFVRSGYASEDEMRVKLSVARSLHFSTEEMLFARSSTTLRGTSRLSWSVWSRNVSTSAAAKHTAYETTFPRPPSAYGWQYHLDNTIQFVLWAAFGSAAIHLLNIKQKYTEKERRLSTKIAILKDIIRRVGDGEDVDIARELKVGKTEEEREWEQIMNSFKEDSGIEIKQSSESAVDAESSLKHSIKDSTSSSSQDGSSIAASHPIARKQGWFWS